MRIIQGPAKFEPNNPVPMRTHSHKTHHCSECNSSLDLSVYEHSIGKFKIPLCHHCQESFKTRFKDASQETRELYHALKRRGVHAQLEKNTGLMTIDIATSDAIVNIEVEGLAHNYSAKHALADLKRSYHAFKRGYLTLKIPISLLKSNLEETAQYITDFLKENRDQLDWAY